jgi:restriction system protein
MARGEVWKVEIKHAGLNKYRVIRGKDKYVVEQKANAQLAAWNEIWERKQAAEQKIIEKERKAQEKEANKELAQEKTEEAWKALESLRKTLKFTLDIDDTIDWDNLKDHSKFRQKPTKPAIDMEPNKLEPKYNPKLGLFDKIFKSRAEKKLQEAEILFKRDHGAWTEKKNAIERSHDAEMKKWEKEKEKVDFLRKQEETNKRIDKNKIDYFNKEASAIYDYCDLVLANSQYPDYFPQEFNLDYNSNNGILIVDYSLPDIESIPKLKEVKYTQPKNEFKESYMSDAELWKLYDELLYQITLRSIHELYEADVIDALKSIVFNGWVESIDKGGCQIFS